MVTILILCLAWYQGRSSRGIAREAEAPQAMQASEGAAHPVVPAVPDTASAPASVKGPAEETQAEEGVLAELGCEADWPGRNPAARRARELLVAPRFLVVAAETLQVGDSLRIPLFDRRSVLMEVTHSELWGRDQATLAVRGKLREDPHGFVTMTMTGGTLRAWIKEGPGGPSYQIRHDPATKAHLLLEIDHFGSEIYGCGNESHGLETEALAPDNLSSGLPASTGSVVAGAEHMRYRSRAVP